MTYLNYEYYKNKWHNVKPIRGRDEDVRPIGKRRRDWERVTQIELPNGEYAYAARLYQTNVVTYNPDGSIHLMTDSWATPLTAEFMTRHSPFLIRKTRGNLWAKIEGKQQIIPLKGRLVIRKQNGVWVVENPPEVRQMVVDRVKIKGVRDRIRPFLNYVNTMLKLSDGWIMADSLSKYDVTKPDDWRPTYDFGFNAVAETTTHKMGHLLKSGGVKRTSSYYNKPWYVKERKEEDALALEQVLNLMSVENLDMWERMMYQMLEGIDEIDFRVVRSEPVQNEQWKFERKYKDRRFALSCLNNRVDAILKNGDVFTTRTVDTSTCIRGNLVI